MNSYLMSMCTSSCSLHLTTMGGKSDTLSGHFIWKYELISSFWVWVSVCTSSETGGDIWDLIWVLHLTSWPSCALHLKTWPNSAICFKWALIDDIDQWRPHLLSLAVLHGGHIWEVILVLHLKIWVPGR